MEPRLAAVLIAGTVTAGDLLLGEVAIVLGAFAMISPRRAAEIWGSERLHKATPERQASLVRWYRVFGIVLFLAGALLVLRGG